MGAGNKWPMAAVVLRALGLAILVVAAGFTALAAVACIKEAEDALSTFWNLAFAALLVGGVCCLASLIVRLTTGPRASAKPRSVHDRDDARRAAADLIARATGRKPGV